MSKNNFTNENEFDFWIPDLDPGFNPYNPYKPTGLDAEDAKKWWNYIFY